MSIWNSYEVDLISTAAQTNFFPANNATAISPADNSEYAKILAEKISEVDSEFEDAKNNLSEQNQSAGGKNNSSVATETIKRFMPDGSIMITTYEGSSIVQQIKLRPHLVPVADYSAPPSASGEPQIELKPQQSLDLLSLLM